MFNRQTVNFAEPMRQSGTSVSSSSPWKKDITCMPSTGVDNSNYNRYNASQYPSNGFAARDIPRSPLGARRDSNMGPFEPQKADLASQYTTNNTVMRESLVESRQATAQKENNFTSSYSYQVGATPNRNASPSPISYVNRSSVLSKSPVPSRPNIQTKSPIPSPMRASTYSAYSANKPLSSISSSPVIMDFCPCLESQGLSMEDLKNEKAVNSELAKIAKDYLDMAKLLQNTVSLLKRDISGSCHLASQHLSRTVALKADADDAKRRLSELHSVCF